MATTALSLGWRVIGIDNKPQPNYPGEFILADALYPPLKPGADLVWLSPPCQGYSRLSRSHPHTIQPKLIPQLREVAKTLSDSYVIENVPCCHDLLDPISLCGFMFGLPLIRHRHFESSFFLPQPRHQHHTRHFFTVVGNSTGTLSQWQNAMYLFNISRYGLTQAVPFAYTWWILSWYTASKQRS